MRREAASCSCVSVSRDMLDRARVRHVPPSDELRLIAISSMKSLASERTSSTSSSREAKLDAVLANGPGSSSPYVASKSLSSSLEGIRIPAFER
jgi:hypothetical protein